MALNNGTYKDEEIKMMIDQETEEEIKEKALTNILDVVKWELEEDKQNFDMLPLSDFQKEELLFNYLKDDKKELYELYSNIRTTYDIHKEKQKKYDSLYKIMDETIDELESL